MIDSGSRRGERKRKERGSREKEKTKIPFPFEKAARTPIGTLVVLTRAELVYS
jgi:hypothetical protein